MPFKLGCCMVQYNFVNYPFEDALKSIKSIGFEGVETYVPARVLRRGRTHLREILNSNNLQPAKFVLGGFGIDSKVGILAERDPSKVRESQKNYRKNVLLAHDNGFHAIVIFTGPRPKGMKEHAALRLAAENLAPSADFAKDHDVEVVVETHKGALAHDSNSLLELRESSASNNIFANVDPSNYWTDGDDVIKAVEKLGALVRGVHVKDVIKIGGKAYWAPAGKGYVDWSSFLRALKSIGYDRGDGWVNIEYEAGISGKYDKDPVRGSMEGYEYISSLLKKF